MRLLSSLGNTRKRDAVLVFIQKKAQERMIIFRLWAKTGLVLVYGWFNKQKKLGWYLLDLVKKKEVI